MKLITKLTDKPQKTHKGEKMGNVQQMRLDKPRDRIP